MQITDVVYYCCFSNLVCMYTFPFRDNINIIMMKSSWFIFNYYYSINFLSYCDTISFAIKCLRISLGIYYALVPINWVKVYIIR